MVHSSAVTISLVVLCSALGWMVYEDSTQHPPAGLASTPSVTLKGAADAKIALGRSTETLPPIDAFREIVARPLFNPSRRPIVADSPVTAAKKPELNIMLSGIVIDQSRQIAHLRSPSDKHVQALGVGDQIDNWRIEAIEPDRVVLRAGNQVETLYMQKFGAENAAERPDRQNRRPRALPRPNRNTGRAVRPLRVSPPRRVPADR